jgi:hypothetical protein
LTAGVLVVGQLPVAASAATHLPPSQTDHEKNTSFWSVLVWFWMLYQALTQVDPKSDGRKNSLETPSACFLPSPL